MVTLRLFLREVTWWPGDNCRGLVGQDIGEQDRMMSRLEAEMQVEAPDAGEFTFALLDKGNGKAGRLRHDLVDAGIFLGRIHCEAPEIMET